MQRLILIFVGVSLCAGQSWATALTQSAIDGGFGFRTVASVNAGAWGSIAVDPVSGDIFLDGNTQFDNMDGLSAVRIKATSGTVDPQWNTDGSVIHDGGALVIDGYLYFSGHFGSDLKRVAVSGNASDSDIETILNIGHDRSSAIARLADGRLVINHGLTTQPGISLIDLTAQQSTDLDIDQQVLSIAVSAEDNFLIGSSDFGLHRYASDGTFIDFVDFTQFGFSASLGVEVGGIGVNPSTGEVAVRYGTELYLLDSDFRNALHILDDIPRAWPTQLAFSADGTELYVYDWQDNNGELQAVTGFAGSQDAGMNIVPAPLPIWLIIAGLLPCFRIIRGPDRTYPDCSSIFFR